MYRPLFTYPVLIATGLLVLHSWLFRGRRNTLIFWGAGYLFAFLREFVYQNFFGNTYRFTGADFKLLNVPITIPMGWLFEAYTSLYIAQFLMGADVTTMTAGERQISARSYGKRVLPVIALACVVTSTITLAIENVAVRMHWWELMTGGYAVNPGWVIGHTFTVFWLLTLLIYLTHKPLRLQRNLAYVICALGFNAVVELGFFGSRALAHAWIFVPVVTVNAGFLATLFMWRQLFLFFFVSFILLTIGDVNAWFLASLIGLPDYETFVALLWTMSVMLLYGLYLHRTQRPERPLAPSQLL